MNDKIYKSMINEIHILAELKKPCVLLYVEDYQDEIDDAIINERVAIKANVNTSFELLGMVERARDDLKRQEF